MRHFRARLALAFSTAVLVGCSFFAPPGIPTFVCLVLATIPALGIWFDPSIERDYSRKQPRTGSTALDQ